MDDPRVPITLLTGFLGAGKTTLLNAILADGSSGRVAVIVNEFGEAGLDHDLILESTEEIALMQSGCLCCSIRGDLSKTVARLLHQKSEGEIAIDRIVIETTGLADPGPITQTLLLDRLLANTTRLDGIVTVADAFNGEATLDAQFEAVSQAAMADLIVLSKTDLATHAHVRSLEKRLSALNPGVRIIHSIRGEGVSSQLWGLSAMKPKARKKDVIDWTLGDSPQIDPLENLSGFAPAHHLSTPLPVSNHDTRIGTASIIMDDPIDSETFDRWLDTITTFRGQDILRVKGIVFLEGLDAPFVFHGVQSVFDQPVQLDEWPKDDRRSRIVVIARDLSCPDLQNSLELLRVRPDVPSTSHVTIEETL